MVTIKTRLLPPGACAFTVWPFVFLHPKVAGNARVLLHESVHCDQQRAWAVYGLGVGLLAWFVLYLLALPVGWNYWRAKWERQAMKAEGRAHAEITEALRHKPYFLWWLR